MALPTTPQDWVTRLSRLNDQERPQLERLGRHYDLRQDLSYMHPELWMEVSERIKPVLLAWPQLVVDSVEERLDVTGFRYTGDTKNDDRLWGWWQANNLDEGSEQLHLEALVRRRGFVIVGASEDPGVPRITVETPLQMVADFDPQTRQVRAALKRWSDEQQTFSTLYLPNATIRYENAGTGLKEIGRDEHNLGRVPVVPFVNRGRIISLDRAGLILPPGTSEMEPILPLSDAACKVATDMMVAAETVAIPARYAFGLSQDEFVDREGNQISPWRAVLGKLWAHEDPEIKAGQWPAADLKNFHETLNQLARMTAAVAALPPHYLGFTTDNPASADAIRSNEARLVKRAERKQVSFGESWEAVMGLAIRIVDGEWDANAARLETRWRDAATPTKAQAADATVKLVQARVIPPQQGQVDLGYSQGEIDQMRAWMAHNASDPIYEAALKLAGGDGTAPSGL